MERAYHIETFVSSILIKKIIKLVKMEWGNPLLVREIDNLQRKSVFQKGYLSRIALTAPERERGAICKVQSSRIKISHRGNLQ